MSKAVSDYTAVDQHPFDPSVSSPHRESPSSSWLRTPLRHRRFGRMTEWLMVLLAGFVLLGALATILLLFGERDYSDRIYPNISVRGMNLGTYTTESAHTVLERHYASFKDHPIELVYGDQLWRPNAEQLGVHLDVDAALSEAMAVGRSGTRVENAQTVTALWEQGVEVPLHVKIDVAKMQRYLQGIARDVETPPENADVVIHNTDVRIISDKAGTQVLIDETMQEILAALQDLEPRRVDLRTRSLTAVVRVADVEPVANEARTILSGPIVLTSPTSLCHPSCTWEWSPEQIARWVSLHHTTDADGRPHMQVNIDQTGLREALLPIATQLREEGALPRVNWNDGNLAIYQQGTPGRGLDATRALADIYEIFYARERTLDLPLTEIPPQVTESNLASLGITEQIGVGSSSFRASEGYRITNIRAGARRMHGVLIPPGGTFSFNQVLGPVDARGGFVQGLAIVNNRTQKEWGGGLCQVSTTMFRAAFWSGLPITERHEHSFRIGWYEELGEPPGLDAAIFTGSLDMRFVNDTGGWLLTQSWVDLDRQRLFISIFGAPTGRSVSISHSVLGRTSRPAQPVYVDDPTRPRGYLRQTDYAQGGMTVQVYRVVRQGDAILWQDTFDTTFKPWPNIFLRGTG